MSPWPILATVALDALIGDPPRPTHPVVLIGRLIAWLEARLYRPEGTAARRRGLALTALTLLTTIAVLLAIFRLLRPLSWLGSLLALWWCASALAARSLDQHAKAVEEALQRGDLSLARARVSRLVGRDTEELDEAGVARAAVESVAENTADGVLCPLSYLVLGYALPLPGMTPLMRAALFAIAYKAVNTLDSMVGYRNARYRQFGWASARLDDLVNYLPARFSALMAVLASPLVGGSLRRAARVVRRDGRRHPSPNSGWTEAAFAGALGCRLGGPSRYGGVLESKPTLGDGDRPLTWQSIRKARHLLWATTVLATLLLAVVVGILPW